MAMRKTKESGSTRGFLAGMAAGLALLSFTETAGAQEILVTGPLAGAPAVRKLRLRREGRFEIAPVASFTLLDEYQRQIFLGLRLNYSFTDWLGLGVWGAYGAGPFAITTGLAEDIQDINVTRGEEEAMRPANPDGTPNKSVNTRLTENNIGPNFTEQLSTMEWVAAPQLTFVPFRGKIAIFQNLYVDTDLFIFAGPAFVGVSERAACGGGTGIACSDQDSYAMESRIAIAPTFGLGFSFYFAKFASFGFDWRGMPFARNTGGFDNRGGGPNGDFPDLQVNEDDRELKFNNMLSVSFGFQLPADYRVSE